MTALVVSASAAVSAAPERVWELISDTSRYAEWVSRTDAVTRSDGPARPGSTYDEINPILGPWKSRSRRTVTELDRRGARSIAARACRSRSRSRSSWRGRRWGGSASEVAITLRAVSSAGPIGAAFARLMAGRVGRDNRRSVRRLAEIAPALG